MNEAKIIGYFQKRQFDKALLELKNQNRAEKKVAKFYKYFIYEISGEVEKKINVYNEIVKYFKKSPADLQYNLAIFCQKLISFHSIGFYSYFDILRFLEEALKSNPKHAESLFRKGEIFFDRGNFKEGLKLINKACGFDRRLTKQKKRILYSVRINNISKDNLRILAKEVDAVKWLKRDCKIYFIRLELYAELLDKRHVIGLYNQKGSIVKDVSQNTRLYRLMADFYLRTKHYKNSLKFCKILGLRDEAECYFIFKKYSDAIATYNKLIKQLNGYKKIEYYYRIAECYFYLKKKKAIDFLDKILSDATEIAIKSNLYTKAVVLKAKIQAEEGIRISLDDIGIEFFRLKYLYDREKQDFVRKNLSDVLVTRAEICLKLHEKDFLYKAKLFIRKNTGFNTYSEYQRLVNDIQVNVYFQTNFRTIMSECDEEYALLNGEHSKSILKIISLADKKEKKLKIKAYEKIVSLSKQAARRFGEKEETLKKLAYYEDEIASECRDRRKLNKCVGSYLRLIRKFPREAVHYNNLSLLYDKLGDIEKAIKYIKIAVRKTKLSPQRALVLNNQLDFTKKIICRSNNKKQKERFQKAYDKILEDLTCNAISDLSLGVVHTRRNFIRLDGIIIYKYRVLNIHTIDSLLNGYLSFSYLQKLNDPLDMPIFQMQNNVFLKQALFKKEVFKVSCFTRNCSNNLMWSHYADSHQGICIGYRISSLPLSVGWRLIDYKLSSARKDEISKEDGLLVSGVFSKLYDWRYEEELRLIRFNDDGDRLFYYPLIKSFEKGQKMECRISEIVLGCEFSLANTSLIRNIVEVLNRQYKRLNLPNILVYKMKQEENKPFSLIKERLDS